jgi:hypothetical protein
VRRAFWVNNIPAFQKDQQNRSFITYIHLDMRPTLRSPKELRQKFLSRPKAKPAIFLGYVEGTTHHYWIYDVAKRTVIVDQDVCFIDDVRPTKKAHPSQIVEWEADSLPKEASLEIQNRLRLEFEGEQQHNELSSKPNLTIPTEEKPQGSQEMSLDSETIPLANTCYGGNSMQPCHL